MAALETVPPFSYGWLMRPLPPDHLADDFAPTAGFSADASLERWARETFINPDGALANEDHYHLIGASIGMVWTNALSKRHGRMLLGQCEMMQDSAGNWGKARGLHLIRQWFGEVPDFLITLYAPWCAQATDREFAALVSHELYHAGQKIDEYGNPCFSTNTGEPLFAIKGHDFEEFVGVVNQFGATSNALRAAAEAIMAGPLIDDGQIEIACATCAKA